MSIHVYASQNKMRYNNTLVISQGLHDFVEDILHNTLKTIVVLELYNYSKFHFRYLNY